MPSPIATPAVLSQHVSNRLFFCLIIESRHGTFLGGNKFYPIKWVLIDMQTSDEIDLDSPIHEFCI